MSSDSGVCPECLVGYLRPHCTPVPSDTCTWRFCPTCRVTFDGHGHAYDRDWRQINRRGEAT